MLMFGLMDAASKYLSTRYPTPQIIWLRYVFTIPLALLVLGPRGTRRALRSRRPWLQVLRSLLLVLEIGLVVWCFGRLPLADVHAVLALTPLAVTALAVPLLGEPVGPRRWAAVGVGFLGVLIILRPGARRDPAGGARGAGLGPALRTLPGTDPDGRPGRCRRDQPALAARGRRRGAQLRRALRLAHARSRALAAVRRGGRLGRRRPLRDDRALQLAPAASVQPFSYTLLLWAVVIGYVGFGDLPDRGRSSGPP